MAIPAIHQGVLAPPTAAAAAARCSPVEAPEPAVPLAPVPHWLQNLAPAGSLAPHWLQKRPPSFAPQLWQKLPLAGLPHWGQEVLPAVAPCCFPAPLIGRGR